MDFSHTPLADPETLRRAMRQWVAGVTVVSSTYNGELHGMTVSSFTSISASPPMILISLERGSRTYAIVSQSGVFGVTLLSSDQEALSDRFAGRTGLESDRFSGLETFSLVSGSPLIPGGLAYFDCRVVNAFEAGTSTVFLAEVMAASSADDGQPLVYTDRTYRRLAP
jgi:flavin reductase (DIM6/NTAB) family NADH-FMN oxidoreductase RutF